MNQSDIEKIRIVPQPKPEEMGFRKDLTQPLGYVFEDKDAKPGFLSKGVSLKIQYPNAEQDVETAFTSLNRVLAAKKIAVNKNAPYTITFKKDTSLKHEEYIVDITENAAELAAADSDGLRRAIYFLEDKLCEKNGTTATTGKWRRKPYVKNRISRCFFGPTYRPPFYVDELMNDVDYYPEEYMNKLAHESINGLWLSMYFRDLPSTVFEGRGKDAEKRFEKLRLTVKRCLRYGIRIFIYICEPKGFGDSHYTIPMTDAKNHPELIGMKDKTVREHGHATFCTSTEAAQTYFRESVTALFTAVPDLGGIINIILGEDNGACVGRKVHTGSCDCPVCAKRDNGEIFRESAKTMADAMHKINPDADLIEWFYAPGSRDGKKLAKQLAKDTGNWPDDIVLMLNFESGGVSNQLGKGRNVFDYSLAYIGPSELYKQAVTGAAKPGAKLQVGCSHEDASVPFIPVPGNLYEKYKTLHELNVSTVMQCWYFGNYPGLMNKAAGELSFEPFPASEDQFLTALAEPIWRDTAPVVAEAWKHFATGYRSFPANIAFAWYGPLHHSISWPLHLFPVDGAISPSWLLKHFPEVSGDRVGETLIYQHTLNEAITLCENMRDEWQKGVDVISTLSDKFANNPDRMADIFLTKAILLQIKSTCNFLNFYKLRETMLFYKVDNLTKMAQIVNDEIANSKEMSELCKRDSRLGYHSEAEGYLFFPKKLAARIKFLQKLLKEDFPKFNINAPWIAEYTGEKPTGKVAYCPEGAPGSEQPIGTNGITWAAWHDNKNLYVRISGIKDKGASIEIEPCRMWPSVLVTVAGNGKSAALYEFIHRDPPQCHAQIDDQDRITTSMPLSLFDGYKRDGFPMRINITCGNEQWVAVEPWPVHLLHRNFNPKAAGWLIF